MNTRFQSLTHWVSSTLSMHNTHLEPLVTEASKRQFYRLNQPEKTWVVMDSPPAEEPLLPFIMVANAMRAGGLNAPEIIAIEQTQGFVLMSDLGQTMYSQILNEQTMSSLYQQAIDALIQLHSLPPLHTSYSLPRFDAAFIRQELGYFETWFLAKHLSITIEDKIQAHLQYVYQHLITMAQVQPQVFLHRDYHSRNLIFSATHNPGIVDVQDAVLGPLVYDLVSLLKDCYLRWPRQQILPLVEYFYQQACQKKLLTQATSFSIVLAWFDWLGLQRHLKVLGVFSRLHHRDGKSHYLEHLPRIIDYVIEAAGILSEASFLKDFFESTVQSKMIHVNQFKTAAG